MKPLSSKQRRERLHNVSSNDDDARTEFQKDADRILYSSEFRRLQGVTQVVGPHEGQIFHNRLTHSIKVAQTGRRLAQRFVRDWKKRPDKIDLTADDILDPDVVEAACLAHDLGHPPFGHVAEDELFGILDTDDDRFEGNAQSFRILTKLAILKDEDDSKGLGLTHATLNAVMKYPFARKPDWPKGRKYGFYAGTEGADFAEIRPGREPTKCLEAEVMDFADDVAYSFHDLHDFIRARLIPVGQLSHADVWSLFVSRWATYTKGKYGDGGTGKFSDTEIDSFAKSSFVQDDLRLGLFRPAGYNRSRQDRALLQARIAEKVGDVLNQPNLKEDGGVWSLEYSTELRLWLKLMQRLVWEYVIEDGNLASQQRGQRKIVRKLFEVFRGALEKGKDGRSRQLYLIPASVLTRDVRHLANEGGVPQALQCRVAVDAVCSLTDQEATHLYARLMGVEPGSVFSRILA